MAERVEVQTGDGGNGFNLKLSENKALGITGPVVVPALCLLLVGVIGWIRSSDLKDSLTAVNTHLQALYARQESIRTELDAQTKEILTALRDNREVTGDKISTLTASTVALHQAIAAQTTELSRHFEQQTRELTQRLSILSFNIDRPMGERLPLNIDPEHIPKNVPPPSRDR